MNRLAAIRYPLPANMQGVTLLETLITFFVLSAGMLGLAFMQAQAVKLNTDSYVRTQATMLAYDYIDRMKLNLTEASVIDPTNNAYVITSTSFGTTASCDSGISNAANDVTCWETRVRQQLPAGRATVSQSASGEFTITLFWVESLIRQDPNDLGKEGVERSQSWVFKV